MLTWAQLILKVLSLIGRILSFLKIQKAKQEGREEVVSEVNKQTEEFKDEAKKSHDPDRSVDTIADELRRRYERGVHSPARVSGTSSNTATGN